jgi:hypothetical protein
VRSPEEILLRLLSCAAVACVDFCALVPSPRFLRHHHVLHPDPGALSVFTFPLCDHAMDDIVGVVDFSFRFLPAADPPTGVGAKEAGWMVRDQFNDRFLQNRAPAGNTLFTELAVCDSLSHCYVPLSSMPEDLAAAIVSPLTVSGGHRQSEPFLALGAAADDDAEAMPPFTVTWMARCTRRVIAFSFSLHNMWCSRSLLFITPTI